MEIILPTWLGSFYGSDFSYEEYERRTVEHFSCGNTTTAESMNSRWFDYYRLHPLQATYYFVHCYREIASGLSKKYFGKDIGTKYPDFLDSRERSSFWNARSSCDMLGVSYPWFISAMLEYRLSSGQFKNYIPRPQHLGFRSEDELTAVKELWETKIKGTDTIMSAKDPYFRVWAWKNTDIQRKHEALLLDQVSRKIVKRFAIKDLVYVKQVLRVEAALKDYSDEVRDAQRTYLSSTTVR